MKVEIKYPKRSRNRNFDKDWDVKVNYKAIFPTKADIDKDYVTLPIPNEFWAKVGVDANEKWVLDKIFGMMNKYETNPMSIPEMQDWIRSNEVSHTSMSVGDIIILDNNIYVCDVQGWKEVQ